MSARPSAFDTLKPLAGRALEVSLNRLVALDPDTQQALAMLEGKRIELVLEAPTIALSICVHEGRLVVGPSYPEKEADLGLRSTLGGLLSQLPFLKTTAGTPVGKLRINGDADLARRLQQLADRFDPDWEKPFAQALGPLFGPQAARLFREALLGSRQLAGNLARDGAEYLTEESRDLVGKAELAAFHDDVDALRDDAERMIVRVGKLLAKTDAPEPGGAS